MKKILCLIILVFLCVTSCNSMPQRLSSNPQTGKYEELGNADCTACGLLVLGLIPVRVNSTHSRAYKAAITSKGGNDLINPVVQESWWWAFIGTLRCTKITGTVIKYK